MGELRGHGDGPHEPEEPDRPADRPRFQPDESNTPDWDAPTWDAREFRSEPDEDAAFARLTALTPRQQAGIDPPPRDPDDRDERSQDGRVQDETAVADSTWEQPAAEGRTDQRPAQRDQRDEPASVDRDEPAQDDTAQDDTAVDDSVRDGPPDSQPAAGGDAHEHGPALDDHAVRRAIDPAAEQVPDKPGETREAPPLERAGDHILDEDTDKETRFEQKRRSFHKVSEDALNTTEKALNSVDHMLRPPEGHPEVQVCTPLSHVDLYGVPDRPDTGNIVTGLMAAAIVVGEGIHWARNRIHDWMERHRGSNG